MLVNGNTK